MWVVRIDQGYCCFEGPNMKTLQSCVCVKSLQFCPALCDSMDCSPTLLYPWGSPGKNPGGGCHFLLQGIFPTQGSNPRFMSPALASRFITTSTTWEAPESVSVIQLCPTLCRPMDCSLPGSSVHRIFQARILEWVAISSSKGSFQPRDQTQVSCIAGRFFTNWATRETH